jgi:hypothetical protein
VGTLGPFFWSLVLGTAVSPVLERGGWKRLRSEAAEGREARAGEGEGSAGIGEP